jgi:hypothetical protein
VSHGVRLAGQAEVDLQTGIQNKRNDQALTAGGIDPEWFERVWKNFHPGMKNFHYFKSGAYLYESIENIPAGQLPKEVTQCSWPEGWIDT